MPNNNQYENIENSNDNPLVTIIVPAYNHQDYVTECIGSIINQTYREIELIILNDGSRDQTHEKILDNTNKCQKRFIRFEYINKENEGITRTLNKGLEWAQGKYISLLASDDMILPEKIAYLVNEAEKLGKEFALISADAHFMDSKSRKVYLHTGGSIHLNKVPESYNTFTDYHKNFNKSDFITNFGTYESFMHGNYIASMSLLIKTEAIKDVGMYTNDIGLEDYDLFLKLAKKYKMKYFDKVVALYRIHENSTMRQKQIQLLQDTLTLLEREKLYCKKNNYKKQWQNRYYKLLFHLIRQKPKTYFFIYAKKIINFPFFLILIKNLGELICKGIILRMRKRKTAIEGKKNEKTAENNN